MKLLLDQNLSRKLVPHLQERYPGTTHVFLVRLAKASDSDIWYYARREGFTIATKNTDMADLCVLRGAPPKVLWLRVGNCSTAVVASLFERNERRIRLFDGDPMGVALPLLPYAAVE